MIMALSLQLITSLLLITATSSSSPNGITIDLVQRRTISSSSRLPKTDDQPRSSPYADTVFDTAEYLMKLQIGTPPFEIEAVLDTGSDLIWTQCLPCLNCYDQQAPIFDPSKSSTYKAQRCDGPDHSCPYEVIYADQSYSKGTLASETVTIKSTSGQPFVLAETFIGCGNNNTKVSPTASGIVGLSWGPRSFISQMGDRFLGLFSYCFSGEGTSKINFGENAIVAGDGTVATNMFRKKDEPDLYYLNLDAVSVGETRVETLGTPFHAVDGNMFIDSGATYTYFPESYCNKVKDAVANAVTAERSTAFSPEMLCYKSNTIEIFPVITMHFSGGADLVLDRYNMYMNMGEGVYCVTIMCGGPTQDGVFGNRAQNNWLVGYDTSSELVSFKSTDCSALWS